MPTLLTVATPFTRSRTDRWLAGVCGGIAQHLNIDAIWVRLAVVAGTLFGIPTLLPYIIAAVMAPEQQEAIGGPDQSAIDWGEDHMRVTAHGPLIPFTCSWNQWAFGWGLFGLLSLPFGVLCVVLAAALAGSGDPFIFTAFASLFSLIQAAVISAVFLSLAAATVPFRYTFTCTHVSLWIKSPLTQPRQIVLSRIESLRKTASRLELRLTDGEMVPLPSPKTSDDLDILLGVLGDARRRAGDHARDLAEDHVERERLQRLLESRPKQRS